MVATAEAAIALFVAASAMGSESGTAGDILGVSIIAAQAMVPITPYVTPRAATSFNPSASE
jgi:hypothetical protein